MKSTILTFDLLDVEGTCQYDIPDSAVYLTCLVSPEGVPTLFWIVPTDQAALDVNNRDFDIVNGFGNVELNKDDHYLDTFIGSKGPMHIFTKSSVNSYDGPASNVFTAGMFDLDGDDTGAGNDAAEEQEFEQELESALRGAGTDDPSSSYDEGAQD